MSINLDFGSLDLDTNNNISVRDISIKGKKNVKPISIAKSDSSTIEEGKITSQTIDVTGDIAGTSYANLLVNIDTLKAGLMNGKQKFEIDTDRYINAIMNSFSYKYKKLNVFAEWKASFIANYPYWLADSASTDSRTPTSGVGYNVTNSGNAPARLKIRATAPAGGISDNLAVANSTTGEGFAYRGDITAAQVLEVNNRFDTDEFEVLNNAVDDHVNYEGDFLTLAAGVNEIVVTGEANTAIILDWRNTWY